MMLLADIILPLSITDTDTYTYIIPSKFKDNIGVGCRVIVPLGKKRFYTGIIFKIHKNAPPANIALKEIYSIIDFNKPIINKYQLKLWRWISFYYLTPLGDVMNAAIPSRLKLERTLYVALNENYANLYSQLTLTEKKIVDYLSESIKPIQISKIEKKTNNPNALIHINTLSKKDAVSIFQTIQNKYKEKQEPYLHINNEITEEDVQEALKNAPKQRETYQLLKNYSLKKNQELINRNEFLSRYKLNTNFLKALLDKNIIQQSNKNASWIEDIKTTKKPPETLTPFQQRAFEEIKNAFKQKNVCLLHGVTSSGKTEIYIHLIKTMINKGKQVLYLLPEIALTTQLTKRLQKVFGEDLAVYHSKINDNARVEIWKNMLSDNPFKIIIGVRSAIFMPFTNLGLIVVDEEHDQTYRQVDPSPRYHGRNAAIMYAHLQGAKVLLGSATPSIESYHNAQTGKYGLVELKERYNKIEMPKIEIVDTRDLRRRKMMNSLLSPPLINTMKEALEDKQQVILFRNRRGFAPIIECKYCAFTPKCKHCDVTLTFHKFQNRLKCHYCDSNYQLITECPECKEQSMQPIGSGTEQLCEEVVQQFPEYKVDRLDTDTTRGIKSYEKILTDFSKGESQILVGTRMISKGLDFENVRVVGIIQADSLLNYPTYRSSEEGFQLMMQASGRSGRKGVSGKVIIQTTNPKHPVYSFVKNNDFKGFYNNQLNERHLFKYPPFYRLISIKLRSKNKSITEHAARHFASLLKKYLNDRVLGPITPAVSKIQQYYIEEILLKMEIGLNTDTTRVLIKTQESILRRNNKFKYIKIHYEADI